MALRDLPDAVPARAGLAAPHSLTPDEPYVAADPVVPVRVVVADEQRQGEVLGWRGARVYVRYRTEAGSHLTWLPATAVERMP